MASFFHPQLIVENRAKTGLRIELEFDFRNGVAATSSPFSGALAASDSVTLFVFSASVTPRTVRLPEEKHEPMVRLARLDEQTSVVCPCRTIELPALALEAILGAVESGAESMSSLTLTDAEEEFIYLVREQKPGENFCITIELVDGATWQTSMSVAINGRKHIIRGRGETFSEAWDQTGIVSQE